MSPHFRSDHDAVTMGSLIVLIAVAVYYCSEAYCDILPTTIAKPKDIGFLEKNDSHAIEKGIFWKNLGLPPLNLTMFEELKSPRSTNGEASKRESRLLGSLAFLAGLSFGGLATAASSTVNTIAKLPQGSLSLNLGSSKTSPYFAAYYSPYSVLPYPFFYPGSFGLMPVNPTKPQTTSQDDLTPQVISVFDNRRPIDLAGNNEEYSDEKKFKSASNGEDGADDLMELRAQADRNAEEKTVIRGCTEGQRKHGNSSKGLAREREDLRVDADNSRATLNFRAEDTTAINGNQIMTDNATMPNMTTIQPPNGTNNSHFPGYFYGYPQNVNHVDLTTGSDAYRYHNQINYNLPYEQPANFYRDDKYNVYSSPQHGNPHFSGPFSSDQINEYVSPDFNRFYHSEFQQPYVNGFRPVK